MESAKTPSGSDFAATISKLPKCHIPVCTHLLFWQSLRLFICTCVVYLFIASLVHLTIYFSEALCRKEHHRNTKNFFFLPNVSQNKPRLLTREKHGTLISPSHAMPPPRLTSVSGHVEHRKVPAGCVKHTSHLPFPKHRTDQQYWSTAFFSDPPLRLIKASDQESKHSSAAPASLHTIDSPASHPGQQEARSRARDTRENM